MVGNLDKDVMNNHYNPVYHITYTQSKTKQNEFGLRM